MDSSALLRTLNKTVTGGITFWYNLFAKVLVHHDLENDKKQLCKTLTLYLTGTLTIGCFM